MPNILNKTNMMYEPSVDTVLRGIQDTDGNLIDDDYVLDPDMSAVDGVLPTYWKMDGDRPVPMTEAEKQAVDDQLSMEARYNTKTKNDIMTELWAAMTPIDGDSAEVVQEKTERQARWMTAIGYATPPLFTIFSLHLDNNDYALARQRCQDMVSLGLITQADYDIVDSVLPLVR